MRERDGSRRVRQRGSHVVMQRATEDGTATVPVTDHQELCVRTFRSIHEHVLDVFGGERGVRDLGLLESALFRPRTGHYHDLPSMAAALFESLIASHPFVDGSMRVAFFASDVFLRLNGFKLAAEPGAAHALLTRLLARSACDLAHLLPWIRTLVTPLAAGLRRPGGTAP